MCNLFPWSPWEKSISNKYLCDIFDVCLYDFRLPFSEIHVHVYRSVDATWAWWSFIGQLSTNNQNIKWQGMLCKGDIFINRCGLPLDGQIIIKGQKYLNSTSFSRLRERRRFNKSKNKCWPKYFKNIFLLQKTF